MQSPSAEKKEAAMEKKRIVFRLHEVAELVSAYSAPDKVKAVGSG